MLASMLYAALILVIVAFVKGGIALGIISTLLIIVIALLVLISQQIGDRQNGGNHAYTDSAGRREDYHRG